jgi:hypothetical protein
VVTTYKETQSDCYSNSSSDDDDHENKAKRSKNDKYKM